MKRVVECPECGKESTTDDGLPGGPWRVVALCRWCAPAPAIDREPEAAYPSAARRFGIGGGIGTRGGVR